ncbi:MAG: DUF1566 domain-containing protein, partial [Candidatus Aenigmarchaeota archaeon]|nr:DUF1566 domain-containing protein [Candidatus Aenigmarchaeota archaeon]
DHAPNPRFAIQSDMVLDKESGLVWEKSPRTETVASWESAVTYCSDKGMRLPTIEELAGLVDTTRQNPALPANHPFSNVRVQQGWYWSSTTSLDDPGKAYFMDMSDGQEYSFSKRGYLGLAWCVQEDDGQCSLEDDNGQEECSSKEFIID